MDAAKVQLFSTYLPRKDGYMVIDNFSDDNGPVWDVFDADTLRYLNAYKNLHFGWDMAKELATRKMPFPEVATSDDEWVFRAYLYCMDNQRYRDRAIQGALFLATPQMRNTREVLHSLFVCKNATAEKAAKVLNLDVDTVTAYEQLFFNVVDRHTDATFLRDVVYPDTRFSEVAAHYLRQEDLGRVLLRMGYNNGEEDVLYFAGFRSDVLARLDGRDIPGRLESTFMAHAYILARNGFINQNLPAVRDARNLITAAKQGGEDTRKGSPFDGKVSEALIDELHSLGVRGA